MLEDLLDLLLLFPLHFLDHGHLSLDHRAHRLAAGPYPHKLGPIQSKGVQARLHP